MKKNLLKLMSLFFVFPSITCYAESYGKVDILNADKITQIGLMLAGTISLILILAFILKKTKLVTKCNQGIKIVNSTAMNAKNKLVLVQVDNIQLLLGVGPNGISHLHTFTKQSQQEEPSFEKQYSKECEGQLR
jgi:flagellar protein FliO/FliZ